MDDVRYTPQGNMFKENSLPNQFYMKESCGHN